MLITWLRHRRQGENSIGSAPAKSDGAEESCRLEAVDAAEALGIDAQVAQVAGARLAAGLDRARHGNGASDQVDEIADRRKGGALAHGVLLLALCDAICA